MKMADCKVVGMKLVVYPSRGHGSPNDFRHSGVNGEFSTSCSAPGALDWYALATVTFDIDTPCHSDAPICCTPRTSIVALPILLYFAHTAAGTPYMKFENQFQSDFPIRSMSSPCTVDALPAALSYPNGRVQPSLFRQSTWYAPRNTLNQGVVGSA